MYVIVVMKSKHMHRFYVCEDCNPSSRHETLSELMGHAIKTRHNVARHGVEEVKEN